jgi:hypothetical protein
MKTCPRYGFCLAAAILIFPCSSYAQGTREDFQRAEQFLAGNLRHRIYVADVTPRWIAKKNRFWYRKAGTKAAEFILVDADQNTTGPAFDHARLAESLSKALKREVQSTELPFDSIDFSDDGEGGNPYLIRRRWDYFVQYLLGVAPPPGFAIHEEREAPPARAR